MIFWPFLFSSDFQFTLTVASSAWSLSFHLERNKRKERRGERRGGKGREGGREERRGGEGRKAGGRWREGKGRKNGLGGEENVEG